MNNAQKYIKSYGHNFLTNNIGCGNLELAKDRLKLFHRFNDTREIR